MKLSICLFKPSSILFDNIAKCRLLGASSVISRSLDCSLSKDLTYTQYCDWHDKAIKARNDCMDGIISFEQALKIIDIE